MRRTQHQQRCGHGLGRGVGCRHFMSIHEYVPGEIGPQHCRVPGCKCTEYVDPRTASFTVWTEGEQAGDYKRFTEAAREAKVISKSRGSAQVYVYARSSDKEGHLVALYENGVENKAAFKYAHAKDKVLRKGGYRR